MRRPPGCPVLTSRCLTAQLAAARPLRHVALRDLTLCFPKSRTMLWITVYGRSISEVPVPALNLNSPDGDEALRKEAAEVLAAGAGKMAAAVGAASEGGLKVEKGLGEAAGSLSVKLTNGFESEKGLGEAAGGIAVASTERVAKGLKAASKSAVASDGLAAAGGGGPAETCQLRLTPTSSLVLATPLAACTSGND